MQPDLVLAGPKVVSGHHLYLHSPVWVPGQLTRVLLSARDTDGQFAVLEHIAPHGAASPCHIHHKEAELIYVLEGELMVYLDGVARSIAGGTAVMLPRGREHAFVVESAEARMLALLAPAGFERLILEAGEPVAPQVRPVISDNPLAVERMVALAARYECDITGPPPRATRGIATGNGI